MGVVPRKPRVWPLESREGLIKGPRYPLESPSMLLYAKIIKFPKNPLEGGNPPQALPQYLEPGLIRVKGVIRVSHSPTFVSNLFRKYLIWSPMISGFSSCSDYPVDGTLNLCHETLIAHEKESN